MAYRFLRQDAHPNCWRPLHASGLPIEQLNRGLPLTAPAEEPVLVRISAWAEEPTDFMERPFVVISDRMRSTLERAGVDNVEYRKAQLQPERSERVLSGYWLANILGRVRCVDALASGVEDVDNFEWSTHASLVIAPPSAYSLALFRLAEDPRMILASPHVQSALQAEGLRGVLFQETEMYNAGRAISRSELESYLRASPTGAQPGDPLSGVGGAAR